MIDSYAKSATAAALPRRWQLHSCSAGWDASISTSQHWSKDVFFLFSTTSLLLLAVSEGYEIKISQQESYRQKEQSDGWNKAQHWLSSQEVDANMTHNMWMEALKQSLGSPETFSENHGCPHWAEKDLCISSRGTAYVALWQRFQVWDEAYGSWRWTKSS